VVLPGTDTHVHGAASRDPAADTKAAATSIDGAVANLEAEARTEAGSVVMITDQEPS
jgi:hypothetical protein